jgi:molybdopterin-guanine dinucleotide biosynthesis protein A
VARDHVLAGIFVGGASSRMGSPKGLLTAPNESRSLVERIAAIFGELDVRCVLVGQRADYAPLGVPSLPDAIAGIGPLGGLVSLLEAAGDGYAIACACDMPYVNVTLARRLIEAPPARALTPLADGVLQPLFARYDARACAPVARRRAEEATRGGSPALQALLREVGATALALSPDEEPLLRDWDSPADMER